MSAKDLGLTVLVDDGILHLILDSPGEKVNTLKPEWIDSLLGHLERSRDDRSIEGVVIRSGKPGHFIAGVDIHLFGRIGSAVEFEALARRGQQVLDLIESFPKPVVACIWGSCMGGGTELALACRYRVVAKDPKTRIALPEVKIGLLPGMGGTQRLPRRIGLAQALPYLLTGKNMYAPQARRSGFADAVVSPDYLVPAAVRLIRQGHEPKTARHLARVRRRAAIEGMWPVRTFLVAMARRRVMATTRGHYPAPPAALDAAAYGLRHGVELGLREEARRFSELAMTPVSRSLIQLFFAMNEAKENPFRPVTGNRQDHGSAEAGTSAKHGPRPRIGLVGAGLMGQGIAEVSVEQDMQVTLLDQDPSAVSRAIRAIHAALLKKRRSHQIDSLTLDSRMSGIRVATGHEDLGDCDMVIEAVVERLDVKQALFEKLEASVGTDCILASNTSSLPISRIAERCSRPGQVVGMHYFSPVQKMPLLEIIRTGETSARTLERSYDIGLRQGKVPIVVRDGPGFYTSRILAPYMNEAMLLFEEGADVKAVDAIMRNAGFPIGPFALLDEVGLDVAAHVGTVLAEHFEARGAAVSHLAERLFKAGFTGKKGGAGFYLHGDGTRSRWRHAGRRRSGRALNAAADRFRSSAAGEHQGVAKVEDALVRDRLMLMMVNEAVWCLQDGTLSSARDGDLGAILGLGFPPFLGGPFRWIDSIGAADVCARMDRLRELAGPGFEAARLLREKAADGTRFHP